MGKHVSVILAVSLLAQGLCVPASVVRPRRQSSNISDNSIAESSDSVSSSTVNYDLPPPIPYNHDDDEDDDDLDIPTKYPSDGGSNGSGSNVFSLLRFVSGLLPGSSGSSSEDGQSDLGSLIATLGGIVANLSGDGIDLNGLIASGLGLFAGLLSEGEENPGAVIASYLLTSLDTITGGGAKNNGAFFGKFLSKLIKGTSAGGDPDASSEEDGDKPKDSTGFLLSLLMALSGDMSKGSSGPH